MILTVPRTRGSPHAYVNVKSSESDSVGVVRPHRREVSEKGFGERNDLEGGSWLGKRERTEK